MREFVGWLGPQRARLAAALLIGVGGVMLGLQIAYAGADWLAQVQVALIWLLAVGATLLAGSRLPARSRRRFWPVVLPGLVLLALAVAIPRQAVFLAGGAAGWIVIGQVLLRERVPLEYQRALRHLRRGEASEAMQVITDLIEREPDEAEHVLFRARLHRLTGHLTRAEADYRRAIEVAPDAAAGYVGLAEAAAQRGDYAVARDAAEQALAREPDNWLPAYTLGMVEDRLGEAQAAVEHLELARAAGLPHRRTALLVDLWLARNYLRAGDREAARQRLDDMRQHRAALRDWYAVFESEQAAPLRASLEADVRLAERLLDAGDGLAILEQADERT